MRKNRSFRSFECSCVFAGYTIYFNLSFTTKKKHMILLLKKQETDNKYIHNSIYAIK